MNALGVGVWLSSCLAVGAANAAEVREVGRVESTVFEVEGDKVTLAKRGETCIAQVVRPGYTTAPLILSRDIEGGAVVAQNAFEFVDPFLFKTVERGRSTLKLETRDGRFRIVHTDVEIFLRLGRGEWRPARELAGKPSPVRPALERINTLVADCIRKTGDGW